MPRILIVEDEDKLRHALDRGLTEEGYEVITASDGETGLARAVAETFDCMILDVMLPGRDGIQVLRELRAVGNLAPILMLSARGEIEDRVRGLESGADDYLPKPFAWVELVARVRSCLRRKLADGAVVLNAGGIELDCIHRRLSCGGREVELTVRECELLEYLLRRTGSVVTRDEIARNVWRDPKAGMTNVIDVYVNYVRKKLERVGSQGLIQTVRRVGYVLRD